MHTLSSQKPPLAACAHVPASCSRYMYKIPGKLKPTTTPIPIPSRTAAFPFPAGSPTSSRAPFSRLVTGLLLKQQQPKNTKPSCTYLLSSCSFLSHLAGPATTSPLRPAMSPPTLEDRTIVDHDANGSSSSAAKKRKTSVSQQTYGHYYKEMNTSMVKSNFLSNPQDLGVVAVGFSGGQVCFFGCFFTPTLFIYLFSSFMSDPLPTATSANQA